MTSSNNAPAPSGAGAARFGPREATMKWSKKVYDKMIAEQDLDLICQELANACRRKAKVERRAKDPAMAQAWEQDAQQFISLANRFSAGDFYKIREKVKR
jgi:hypothetical protein